MSHVTSVILSVGYRESDAIEQLNEYLADKEGTLLVQMKSDDCGGSKRWAAWTYWGAFNYLNVAALKLAIRSLAWRDTECVQLFIKDEGEYFFRVWDLDGKTHDCGHEGEDYIRLDEVCEGDHIDALLRRLGEIASINGETLPGASEGARSVLRETVRLWASGHKV